MRTLSFCAAALLAFLQGCSSNPLSPTGEAVYYALSADTHLRTWVDKCSAVNPLVQQQALLTQKNWWQRNAAFIQGADYGLGYDLIQISGDRPETGARMALTMTWSIVQNAEADVKKHLNKGNTEETCQKILAAYDQGQFDINSKNKWYKELVSLQQRQQTAGADLALKQASTVAQHGRVYGRSFYVIENMAKRQGCPGATVQLLKNDWPNEIYDARCQDGSYLIMRCEWGNCRVVE